MTARDYKPIILNTLQVATGKFRTYEDFAEHLVSRMETFEEMLAMAGSSLIGKPPQEPPRQVATDVALGSVQSPVQYPKVDVTQRLNAVAQTGNGELVERYSKDEIVDYLARHLPVDFKVDVKGFENGVLLKRRIERAPGDLNFVRVIYSPEHGGQLSLENGQTVNVGPEVRISTCDQDLNAAAILEEIGKQAGMVLSATPKRVEPRHSLPIMSRLEDGLPGSPSSSTDANASAEDLSQWGAPMAALAASRFKR